MLSVWPSNTHNMGWQKGGFLDFLMISVEKQPQYDQISLITWGDKKGGFGTFLKNLCGNEFRVESRSARFARSAPNTVVSKPLCGNY